MIRVNTKRPSGWTIAEWSPYAGYALRLVQWDVDVYGQHLFELLEGPLKGENRWFKPDEFFNDEPESFDGVTQ